MTIRFLLATTTRTLIIRGRYVIIIIIIIVIIDTVVVIIIIHCCSCTVPACIVCAIAIIYLFFCRLFILYYILFGASGFVFSGAAVYPPPSRRWYNCRPNRRRATGQLGRLVFSTCYFCVDVPEEISLRQLGLPAADRRCRRTTSKLAGHPPGART